jgi:hypothetical protein
MFVSYKMGASIWHFSERPSLNGTLQRVAGYFYNATTKWRPLASAKRTPPRLQIGFTRGKVYFPIRNEDGSVAGFVGYADGQLKMRPLEYAPTW